jgi:hypothetical protein
LSRRATHRSCVRVPHLAASDASSLASGV